MRLISYRNLPAIVSCLLGWGLMFDPGSAREKFSSLSVTEFLARGQEGEGGNEIKEQLKKAGEKSRECARGHKRDSLSIDREQWWKWQL